MTSMWPNDDSGSFSIVEQQPPSSGCARDKRYSGFLLPGLSGDIAELSALLSSAESPLSLAPVHYRHWSNLQRKPQELDRLVADCVRQIKSHGSPDGIVLVGYSFGGLMAWAVAKALAASGRQTILLGLIDAVAAPTVADKPASTLRRLNRLIDGIRRRETDQQFARLFAGALFRQQPDRTRALFELLGRFKMFPRLVHLIDLNLQMLHHLVVIRECAARIAASQEQLPYPVTLFKGAIHARDNSAALGWERIAPKLQVVAIPGNHESVLRPHNAEQIISKLAMVLAENRKSSAG